jgi:hypothetical protein
MESRSGQSQIARARLKSHPDISPRSSAGDGGLVRLGPCGRRLESCRVDAEPSPAIGGRNGRDTDGGRQALREPKGFAQAIAAYERAASMAVDAQGPLVALVQLDLQNKQPERARRRLEGILAAHPDHPYAHGLMGEVLTLLGTAGFSHGSLPMTRPESIRAGLPLGWTRRHSRSHRDRQTARFER